MKFYCDKAELLTAVQTAGRAVASKSTMPALEGLLLQTSGAELIVSGYDLKTGIRTRIEAEVDTPGSIVLNSKLFTDIIRNMPSDKLTIDCNNLMVKISCYASEFEILGSSADDFPELPAVDTENQIRLPEGVFKSIISETLFAVSENDNKPIHTGSLFEINGPNLTVISVDGYRLALRRENIGEYNGQLVEGQTDSFVVPGTMLGELKNICSDSEGLAAITVGSRYIMCKVRETEIISRRLEGEFLDYKRSIPEQSKIEIDVDRKALTTSIERVSLIINDTLKSPLRVTLDDGVVKLKALTPVGKANDECLIKGDGGGLEIGFNNRYMLDALKAAPSDEIKMKFNTAVNPCIITPSDENDDSFLYMILPVRITSAG
ncbi:MAG: DNA polymerase III subunit beta [Oscillospiraceae bacterium]|jgi:DNA polymerase-3 subunit beta|nr:DNA polymerase III subunit beta [Oscillospiraceae bacterium]